MKVPRIVLASTSPYRRALLDRIGIPFEVRSPGIDEHRFTDLAPLVLAVTLARAKAEAIREPDALVIGSDQVVDLDGQVLGKPHTPERAVSQLSRLAGRSHRLLTAVAVHDTRAQRTVSAVDVHTMTMRPLSLERVRAYVAHDAPLDCAGSYRLERRGIALFEQIEADPEIADDTAIVGLPMMKLLRLLRRFGVDVLDLPAA